MCCGLTRLGETGTTGHWPLNGVSLMTGMACDFTLFPSYEWLLEVSEGNKFVAPNHQSPYYFAPRGRVQLAVDGNSPRKKKQKTEAPCCKCGPTNGDCSKRACAKSDSKKCTSCGSSNCSAKG